MLDIQNRNILDGFFCSGSRTQYRELENAVKPDLQIYVEPRVSSALFSLRKHPWSSPLVHTAAAQLHTLRCLHLI